MAIPSPDRELKLSSATGNETAASGVLVKGSFWFIYERYQSLSLREFEGASYLNIRESVPIFHLSQALDSGLNIVTDRFWLWEVTSANELNLVEIEPFSDQSPVIHSTTNIESGVENVRVDIIENEPVRVFILKTGSPNEQWLYVFNDVKSGTPDLTVSLGWTATRLDNYDSVVDSTDLSSFQLMYCDTASPPNIYTVDYTLSVPQIISAAQAGVIVNISWDTVTGGEMYRLQRTINDPAFNPASIYEIYYGSSTSTTDGTVPYNTTFYYRVKLVMPSLGIESAWSTVVGVPIAGYVPPFTITGPRYWVANTDSTWADTTNWSNTSGGPGGYSIPDIQNVVIFDSGGSGECDIDATVNVQGLALNGYSGIVRQNGYNMQMDTTGALFWTGDFSGSGADIRVRGDLNIGGAVNFLSTDQTLSCDSTFAYYDPGVFNHNDGVISLDSSGCMVDGSGMITSALQFNSTQVRMGENCYVERLLVLNSGSARHVNANRNLIVRGDVSCMSGYDQWTDFNNLSILLDSTEQQSITNEIGCIVPTLSVNKDTTDQVVCYGGSPLRIKGDFALYDGTFNTNSLSVQVGY